MFENFYATDFLTSYYKDIRRVFAGRDQLLDMLKRSSIDFAIAYPPLEDVAIGKADIIKINYWTEKCR